MNLARAARLCLALAVIGCLTGPMVQAGWARPKPPPEIVPPPPPPPMPSVGLAATFVDAAAAYAGYLHDAGSISPAFTDAASVASALRSGVAYQPAQLRRGAVAYAAIMALTDQAFVADVRRAGATPEGRYAIEAKIFADPAYALEFHDGDAVAGMVKKVLETGGQRLFDEGQAVRKAAYDIQHQPWSLTEVEDRDGRAAAVKSLSATPRDFASADAASLQQIVDGSAPAVALDPAPGPYSPLVVRAVALATLAAIGEAGDDDATRLSWLTDDYYLDHCLAEAKLSLFECLAVAKPNYEDVFCLGQHALHDTGACVAKSSWSAVPLELDAAIRPLALPRPGHHAVSRRRHRA